MGAIPVGDLGGDRERSRKRYGEGGESNIQGSETAIVTL
jgi:hypothetical protein